MELRGWIMQASPLWCLVHASWRTEEPSLRYESNRWGCSLRCHRQRYVPHGLYPAPNRLAAFRDAPNLWRPAMWAILCLLTRVHMMSPLTAHMYILLDPFQNFIRSIPSDNLHFSKVFKSFAFRIGCFLDVRHFLYCCGETCGMRVWF